MLDFMSTLCLVVSARPKWPQCTLWTTTKGIFNKAYKESVKWSKYQDLIPQSVLFCCKIETQINGENNKNMIIFIRKARKAVKHGAKNS